MSQLPNLVCDNLPVANREALILEAQKAVTLIEQSEDPHLLSQAERFLEGIEKI